MFYNKRTGFCFRQILYIVAGAVALALVVLGISYPALAGHLDDTASNSVTVAVLDQDTNSTHNIQIIEEIDLGEQGIFPADHILATIHVDGQVYTVDTFGKSVDELLALYGFTLSNEDYTEQVANEYGYDLYIKLLNRAVLEEKGTPEKEEIECKVSLKFDALIPESYVPFPAQRMALYKKIALIGSEEDLEDVTDELVDRFGEPPRETLNLLRIALIHTLAVRCGFTSVREDTAGIHITPKELDIDAWSELSDDYPSRLRMIMSGEPHVCLRPQKDEDLLSLLYKMFEKYTAIAHKTV